MNDFLYAVRSLRRNPGFSAVAILALALGIGANTAIFSVVNAVVLRPLPYADAERLVMAFERIPKLTPLRFPFAAPDYEYVSAKNTVFDGIAAYQNAQYELSGTDQPERIVTARVTASLFPVLRVKPLAGRAFTEDEDRRGTPVAILTDALWQRKYGRDPGAIGKRLLLDRRAYTIIGIMPRGFEFPHRGPAFNNTPADLYVPMSFTQAERHGFGMMYNHSVVARLKPAVSVGRARVEIGALLRRFEQQYPSIVRSDPSFSLETAVTPFYEEVVGNVRRALLVLLGAVAIVLLIACADVASLMLTRAAARQREMDIRRALGAGKLALIRQVMTESAILALAAGAIGIVLAAWVTELLMRIAPVTVPRAAAVGIDRTVLLFALALSVLTALVFGLAPSLEASRGEIASALKQASRSASAGRGRQRLLGAFVTAQFALAVVLLAGAGLLMRSFVGLVHTDPGFRPEHVLSFQVSLPRAAYTSGAQIRTFYERLLGRLQAMPGIRSTAAATDVPLSTGESRGFTPERAPAPGESTTTAVAQHWVLGPYFHTLGIRLKRGRYLTEEDRLGSELAVVVNETMARRFWPGQDPIGQRLKWGIAKSASPWMTIVGVVADVKGGPLNEEVEPQTYTPYPQVPNETLEGSGNGLLQSLSFVVRGEGDAAALANSVRLAVRELDSSLPVTKMRTLDELLAESAGPQRFSALLLGGFALTALLLATLGIAGVLAYAVTQRMHEFGIRVALGAERDDVLRLVLRWGMTLATVGILIGLAVSFALTRVLGSLLYGVSPHDPWTFGGVLALLMAVALGACVLPAWRAAQVDPITALRWE